MQQKKQLKNKKITIKVDLETREELHALAEKAGYNSMSQYMLDCSLNPVLYIEDPGPFIETNTHLNRIGVNINQIARKVNTRDYVLEKDLKEIKNLLLQQREYLKLLRDFQYYEKSSINKIERFKSNGYH